MQFLGLHIHTGFSRKSSHLIRYSIQQPKSPPRVNGTWRMQTTRGAGGEEELEGTRNHPLPSPLSTKLTGGSLSAQACDRLALVAFRCLVDRFLAMHPSNSQTFVLSLSPCPFSYFPIRPYTHNTGARGVLGRQIYILGVFHRPVPPLPSQWSWSDPSQTTCAP